MWFNDLFGFHEESPEQARDNIIIDGEVMRSRINGKSYLFGTLETSRLAELRDRVRSAMPAPGTLKVQEVVAARNLSNNLGL